MPRIVYRPDLKFHPKTRALIAKANEIVTELESGGFTVTLRQLYYQLVSQNVIRNVEREYKNLSATLTNARYAGMLDWLSMEDRTRFLRSLEHWDNPASIIESAKWSYHEDLWSDQRYRPEVWVEKDALINVLEGVCTRNDVPYFSCRGNSSASEMFVASQRLRAHDANGQKPIVFYLGDHDPSGVDMTRDVEDRLNEFAAFAEVRRLALNMDQIEEWKPPPQPAKQSDSRYESYVEKTGQKDCWELDALKPQVLADLVSDAIDSVRNKRKWEAAKARQEEQRELLTKVSSGWTSVVKFVSKKRKPKSKPQAKKTSRAKATKAKSKPQAKKTSRAKATKAKKGKRK